MLDDSARAALKSLCHRESQQSGWSPDAIEWIGCGGGKAIVRTYAGDALNRTLAKLFESRGLKVSGNYADVSIEKGSPDPDELCDRIRQLLIEVAEGRSTGAFDAILNRVQKAWPFSPFALMLPDELTRATLVDQTTDIQGLQQFLAKRLGRMAKV